MPWHSREFVVKDCDGPLLAARTCVFFSRPFQKDRPYLVVVESFFAKSAPRFCGRITAQTELGGSSPAHLNFPPTIWHHQ
jgi:hypothetical protein